HLGMVCVAEGAETPAEIQILRECGCELIQGYYFGRPMPGEQIVSEKWHAECAAASAAVEVTTTAIPSFAGHSPMISVPLILN
ncbi:MAG: EAL domain-containing protein, partial [Pirellulaceae bacterium]|nr:EAL domain-containing protein [Pirellulaceae bacterium]